MLKGNLLIGGSQQAESGDEDDLREQEPDVDERPADRQAHAEGGELRRHAELRERADREERRTLAQNALDEPVLPAVEHAVRAAEQRAVPRRGRAAREPLDVE